jgi:hypothetical protein
VGELQDGRSDEFANWTGCRGQGPDPLGRGGEGLCWTLVETYGDPLRMSFEYPHFGCEIRNSDCCLILHLYQLSCLLYERESHILDHLRHFFSPEPSTTPLSTTQSYLRPFSYRVPSCTKKPSSTERLQLLCTPLAYSVVPACCSPPTPPCSPLPF